jgi:hypothetical protein
MLQLYCQFVKENMVKGSRPTKKMIIDYINRGILQGLVLGEEVWVDLGHYQKLRAKQEETRPTGRRRSLDEVLAEVTKG